MKKEMNLSFVQTNPKFGEIELNVQKAMKLANRAKEGIIVFPELFNTGYAFKNRTELKGLSENVKTGYTSKQLIKFSRLKNSTIIAGIAEKANGKFYNTAIIISKGKFIGKYRKIHLFYKEKNIFTPGKKIGLFKIDGVNIGIIICFDWIFPELSRKLAIRGVDVIVHPSNLILKGLGQRAMLTRSVENRIFTITANRIGIENRDNSTRNNEMNYKFTGESQITSPNMKILAKAESNKQICKSVTVDIFEARNKNITKMNNLLNDIKIQKLS
tara:strand:- start:2521 stop:3336 length:816 start_codon:yes stop_codon:yes gene_type:complete